MRVVCCAASDAPVAEKTGRRGRRLQAARVTTNSRNGEKFLSLHQLVGRMGHINHSPLSAPETIWCASRGLDASGGARLGWENVDGQQRQGAKRRVWLWVCLGRGEREE